jgi:hypothetical protein
VSLQETVILILFICQDFVFAPAYSRDIIFLLMLLRFPPFSPPHSPSSVYSAAILSSPPPPRPILYILVADIECNV